MADPMALTALMSAACDAVGLCVAIAPMAVSAADPAPPAPGAEPAPP